MWQLFVLTAALIDFFVTLTWRRTNWFQNVVVDSSWMTWTWLVSTICGAWAFVTLIQLQL